MARGKESDFSRSDNGAGTDQGALGDAAGIEDDTSIWTAEQVEMPQKIETVQITARFDRDVVDWFRSNGRGYQARMNAVLRSYYLAQKAE